MKQLYSIGETAKLMGVSVQMLRIYSNLGLLQPQYINPENGYRYYSFKQFHYIDRIKYLRSLNLSLPEISEILHSGKPKIMLQSLEKRKKEIECEVSALHAEYDDLMWYINYFQYLERYHMEGVPYIVEKPARYVVCVDYNVTDNDESVETRLAELKSSHAEFRYRRQYGYFANTREFFRNCFLPEKYFIYLKNKPDTVDEKYIYEIPSGIYMCLWANKVQIESGLVKKFFSQHVQPDYVLAEEYEDNFLEYDLCPYEMQCLIKK
ncbi:MerR family transcriptional regulator [Pectinatus frisingensis]|uniref:MerR family transcriptional regulator n=1 Tax=Pectinatus frisingensis TaxID=865 RepID=UPI0018C4865C